MSAVRGSARRGRSQAPSSTVAATPGVHRVSARDTTEDAEAPEYPSKRPRHSKEGVDAAHEETAHEETAREETAHEETAREETAHEETVVHSLVDGNASRTFCT